MIDVVTAAAKELENIRSTPTGNQLKTGDIRKISALLYKGIKNAPASDVYSICNELLAQQNWPMQVIAFDFAFRIKKKYNENTFEIFEQWLEKDVRGWGDCDDFCTHAFGWLISQDTSLSKKTAEWVSRDEFWMRRAAAVVLLPSISQGKYIDVNPLRISDILMYDEHHLVLKGYGWMLKALSVKEPGLVFDYLMEKRAIMPRVAFRYALEKMDVVKKRLLMD